MKKFSKLMLASLMIPALVGSGSVQAGMFDRIRDSRYAMSALHIAVALACAGKTIHCLMATKYDLECLAAHIEPVSEGLGTHIGRSAVDCTFTLAFAYLAFAYGAYAMFQLAKEWNSKLIQPTQCDQEAQTCELGVDQETQTDEEVD